MDVNDARLTLGWELGADGVIGARSVPFREEILRPTGEEGVAMLLEFLSNQYTLPSCYRSITKAGRLVFAGYVPEIPMSIMPHELVRNEFEIMGSRTTTKQ